MKIAVVGKGGSGKTTTSAVLARTLARRGRPTLALDCDTNPNLGISLGLGDTTTERLITLREAVDAGAESHAANLDDLVDRFGADAPDGVRLVVVSALENPEPGCPCCGISPEQLLGELARPERSIVADFEAGLGTIMRLHGRKVDVDVFVIVVEATAKSIAVGMRAVEFIREAGMGQVVLAANRVRDAQDEAHVRAAFPDLEPVVIDDEAAIVQAERRGLAPLDEAPDAPGIRALVGLADRVLAAAG